MPVLIVGAGPTGLVLALWLTQIGVNVRLIDQSEKQESTSRALVLHARTLEFYRQLGIVDEVLKKGFRFPHLNLWVNHHPKAKISIDEIGKGVSPFPYVIIFPQDQHEDFLIRRLKQKGVEVERQTTLISFENNSESVTAILKLKSGETEKCTISYLAGCDGARSTVREQLQTGFEGSTYPDLFYVADIVGNGPALNGELHVSLDEAEFLAIFPLKEKGHARLIGVIRESDFHPQIHWNDMSTKLLQQMEVQVENVRWFSTYHVHHRVASHFQSGRVFLLGDAGHIHSPLGAQGMNTGIGDAVNLAWKLGQVLHRKADSDILQSYEQERIAFARQLVHSTDQAFQFVSSTGELAQIVRTKIAPLIVPFLFHFDFSKHFLFRFISQTGISYRHCSLNRGHAGSIYAGDRLPWIESVDNYASLQALDWQIHIYGNKPLMVSENMWKVFHFPWNQEMEKRGLRENVAYLIRPDGHIGMISAQASADEIQSYFVDHTLFS